MTALDSSIVTSLTVLASAGVWVAPRGSGSARRFDTPTAESAPETIPATTATATSPIAPGPRRTTTRSAGCGGRVDHAGAACHDPLAGSRAGSGP
jgi:hypothetical protein